MLLGDYLYAHGLVRVAEAGGVPAVEALAELIARCAAERADGRPDDGAAWIDAARALGGSPDVAIYADPVTPAGRVELLPFLREQSISITNHRFGAPIDLSDDVV